MAKGSGHKRKRKGNLLFGLTARFCMLMAAWALVLSYLALFVNPAKVWIMSVFGLLFPAFVLLNLFLLAWAVGRRSRSLVIPLLALIPTLFIFDRFINFGGGESEEGKSGVSVVSYNLGRFLQGKGEFSANAALCSSQALDYLRGTGADVICLQEFYCQNTRELDAQMKKYFPDYRYEYYVNTQTKGLCGNVTLSRLPIKGKGKFDFEDSSNLALYTDIDFPSGAVRVYNCHFESYNVSIPRIIKSFGKDPELVQETEGKFRHSLTLRPKQVDIIMQHVRNSPLQAMILGDFNDTPMSYTYQTLTRGRRDSYSDAGGLLGGTYSVLWPLLRIDYILPPESLKASMHKVDRVPYSDHYPIRTTLVTL